MPPRPVILFDLDGTLADTAPDLAAAANTALAHHGYPAAPEEDMRAMVGGGGRQMLIRAFASLGVQVETDRLERVLATFLDHYGAHMAERTVIFPHLTRQLDLLEAAGAGLGVVTNKTEHLSRRLLEQLGLAPRFAIVVGGDTLPHKKPHPAPLLHAVAALGGAPEAAVMVGDSDIDAQAAQAAGVAFLGVSFGYGPPPRTGQVIDHYAELPQALHTLLPLALPPLDPAPPHLL